MFGFEIWLDDNCIVEIDDFYLFDTEEEAEEEANNYIVAEMEDGEEYEVRVIEL